MSGSSATSTLDIVLKDDVSPAAKAIAASLQKVEAEAKELDGALAKSGTRNTLQARLKSLGASKDQIEGAAKAWKDYAKAEGLAMDKTSEWTAKQRQQAAAWENVAVAKLRADRGVERAQAFAEAAAARRSEELRQREAKKRVEDAARSAEAEAAAKGKAAEKLAAEERRRQERDVREAKRLADMDARDERRRQETAARDAKRLAEQEARDEQSRVERRMRDDARIAEHEQREQRRVAEAQHRHEEQLAHQREHFAERQGFKHYALQSAAMAVSAHAMVHTGEQAWEQGAELQRERIGLQNAGRTPEEISEIEHAARSVQGSTPTSGYIESLKTIAETTAAFGSVHHAIDNLPFISKMTSILKTAGGDNIHGDAAQLGQAFAKTFEERQTKPEEFESEAKQMIPAMVATGGTFNPEQLYAFAQQAKSALPSLSMRFLSRIAPSLIGAQGGERAGTSLKAFEDVIAGKVNDKKQAEAFLNLGLLDKNMAIMKAGHAVGWKSGAVKDTFLAMTDPLAWSEKYLIPALQKQGVDTSNREAVQMILNTMFRNQNANMFATEIAQEASRHRLHKDEELYGKVGSFDDIYARNLQDFGVAAGALKSALGNLAGAVTVPLMGKVSAGLVILADGINHLANMALEHPTAAATAGVVAAGASLAAAAKIGYGLYNGFGLGASATALTGAAGALEAAAAHLGGAPGGPLGKVPGAAIVPAAEALPAAIAIPGAVELGAAVVAGGLAVGAAGLVKAAFEAQQPGNGGQWAPATLATREEDQSRLADQQAEADRLRAEIDHNKRMEKIPGGSDAVNMTLKDQLAEKLNQIEALRRSLVDIDAAGSHEARVGRAMMAMPKPEEFGPELPPAFSGLANYIDREAERGRAFAAMAKPEEFGPKAEAITPALPPDVAQRLRYVEQELQRSRELAPQRPAEEFGPPMPRDRPWTGDAAPAAAPPAPVTPQVDTSPAEQGLMGLISLSSDAGAQMQTALNVTATPTVETGSITNAIALAQQLIGVLGQVGAAASAAQAAVAGAVAGGANAAVSARRSFQPAPAGRIAV